MVKTVKMLHLDSAHTKFILFKFFFKSLFIPLLAVEFWLPMIVSFHL